MYCSLCSHIVNLIVYLGTSLTYNASFLEQTGVTYVRGCELEGMLDQNGRVIEEGPDPKPELSGDTRTYRLLLDQNQYKIDMENVASGKEVNMKVTFFFFIFLNVV